MRRTGYPRLAPSVFPFYTSASMAPHLFKQRKHGPGRVLVQNAGHGRAQIIPDMIPELTAWLYMLGKRYERTSRSTESAVKKHSDNYLSGVAEYCNTAIELIQRIINIANDKFPRSEWWVAWSDICDSFGIADPIKAYGNFELDDTYTNGEGI